MARRRNRDEDIDSEFELSSEKRKKTWRDDPIATHRPVSHVPTHRDMPSKEVVTIERDKEEWRSRRYHLLSMDAYSRHKALVNRYLLAYGRGIEHIQRSTANDRNDYSILREQHRFLWEDSQEADTWEKRLAKTYYDRLFKEYAISDLSRYKENKIALRWRIEKEVVEGKGQFVCGNKHCSEREALESWEVNFAYVEQGEKKNALVKLRLCSECSDKLNYHHKRKRWNKQPTTATSGSSDHSKKKHRKHKKKHKKTKGEKYEWKEKRSSDESNSGSERDEAESSKPSGQDDEPGGSAVWSKPAEVFLEKSKDEEYDEYFKDMLL